MGSHRSLSSIDLAAFLLARKLKAVLLSGDRHLQQLAVQNGVTTHGSVWILDELIRWEIIAPQKVAETLRKIIKQGARLPAEECNKRFELWG